MLLNLVLMSFIVGSVGTGAGAVLALPFAKRGDGRFLYGFSSGFMLCVVMFDMIPSASQISDMYTGILGVFLGAMFVFVFNRILDRIYIIRRENGTIKTGLLLFIAIALHNFPEGVAIGAGYELELSFAIFISVVMALHNIPEGMAMGISLYLGGETRLKILGYGLIAGLPTIFGALIGNLAANIGQRFIGGGLGFAAGAMLYVCLSELIPQGKSAAGRKFYISFGVGLMFGQIVLILCENLI